jgi:hypothetical protein
MALDEGALKGALGKALKGDLPSIAIAEKSIVLVYPSPALHALRCSADHAAVLGIVKRAECEQLEKLGPGHQVESVTVRFSL